MSAVKLQDFSHVLNYPCTWEYQAKGITKFVHMNGNENPADIVTKIHASNTWFPLVKILLLWHGLD